MMRLPTLAAVGALLAVVVGHGIETTSPSVNVSQWGHAPVPYSNLVSGRAKRWVPPAPADAATWDRAVCKGNLFLTLMIATDKLAGQWLFDNPRPSAESTFQTFPSDFNKWGYYMREETNDPECNSGLYGMGTALKAVGVSEKSHLRGGSLWCLRASHYDPDKLYDEKGESLLNDQEYMAHDGRRLRYTGGLVYVAIDPDSRVLLAMDRKSPAHEAKSREPPIPVNELPDLRATSDIMWGIWVLQMGNQARYFRGFVSLTVTNPVTKSIIRRALDSRGVALEPWPGQVFWMNTSEGKAILGSPNGVGLAYFLLQHRAVLGNKYVKSVAVFASDPDSGQTLNIIFNFGDAPAGDAPQAPGPE